MSMLQQSFDPREWYEGRDWPQPVYTPPEGTIMWVYRRTDAGYTVGFFTPDKEWVPEKDYVTAELAANRCHFLNGGSI